MSYLPLDILPPITPLPKTARTQRHEPPKARDYAAYRACLRWDSGFYCCFCLLHESDLSDASHRIEGTSLTSIEHIQPRSTSPDRISDYANCAYACRYCNTVRGTQPVLNPSGARLLNPWRDVWSEHFRLVNDRFEPRKADPDNRHARYTIKAYRLNDERKSMLRRNRRELILDRLNYFQHDVAELRRIAETCTSRVDRQRILDWAQMLSVQQHQAYAELRRHLATPPDAPKKCRCGHRDHHSLPPEAPVVRVHLPA